MGLTGELTTKVVRYCFPDKREETRRLTSPGSEQIDKSARCAAEELVEEKRDGYRSMAPTAHHVAVDPPRSTVHFVSAHANTGNTSEA